MESTHQEFRTSPEDSFDPKIIENIVSELFHHLNKEISNPRNRGFESEIARSVALSILVTVIVKTWKKNHRIEGLDSFYAIAKMSILESGEF
jgi:hypothetical protein